MGELNRMQRIKRAMVYLWQWVKRPYLKMHECDECGRKFLSFYHEKVFCTLVCTELFMVAECEEWDEQEPPSIIPLGF